VSSLILPDLISCLKYFYANFFLLKLDKNNDYMKYLVVITKENESFVYNLKYILVENINLFFLD